MGRSLKITRGRRRVPLFDEKNESQGGVGGVVSKYIYTPVKTSEEDSCKRFHFTLGHP